MTPTLKLKAVYRMDYESLDGMAASHFGGAPRTIAYTNP
jgi:hypothetical protein